MITNTSTNAQPNIETEFAWQCTTKLRRSNMQRLLLTELALVNGGTGICTCSGTTVAFRVDDDASCRNACAPKIYDYYDDNPFISALPEMIMLGIAAVAICGMIVTGITICCQGCRCRQPKKLRAPVKALRDAVEASMATIPSLPPPESGPII